MTLITPPLLQAMGVSREISQVVAPVLELGRVVPGDSFNTITSRKGVAMLVSQLCHESDYFRVRSESLNYSQTALRQGNRMQRFSVGQAQAYGYLKNLQGKTVRQANQRMIANLYYGSRLGNRGVDTDDGWVFRGGGWIQLTGRGNVTLFGQSLGLSPEKAADFIRTPEGAAASAFWYWRTRGLLVPASHGDVTECTRLIQGADGGLGSRKAFYAKAFSFLLTHAN